jgi:DNA polymerase-3 subunit delta'
MIGHKKQWQFLQKSIELDRIPHGLLFCGQEQLGKKTLAIEFAKMLDCSSKDSKGNPCQACRSCQDMQKGIHPDLILVEPASQKGEIQISQIRELQRKLSLRSYSNGFKIAILDRAHSMNQEAQSCFLKLLEEPRGRTALILITEYPEMLFPTILSRVQRLKFSSVDRAEIEKHIISRGISQKDAKYFTDISSGKPGLAITLAANADKAEGQQKAVSDLIKIGESDLSFRFKYAKELTGGDSEDKGKNLQEVLSIWLGYLREKLIGHFKKKEEEDLKKEIFDGYSAPKLVKIINLLQSTIFLMSSTNINQKLAFEILLTEI